MKTKLFQLKDKNLEKLKFKSEQSNDSSSDFSILVSDNLHFLVQIISLIYSRF